MADMQTQAVIGVIPPQIAEAKIAERRPSVAAYAGVARLGSSIQQAANGLIRLALGQPMIIAAVLLILLLPVATLMAFVAWFLLAPFYFLKIVPFVATRYTLTNHRLMIRKGLKPTPVQEVKLDEIAEVRVAGGTEQPFYRAADLEILSNGKVAMTLHGVPEYQSFKVNIENTYLAWGRREQPKEQVHPASELADKK